MLRSDTNRRYRIGLIVAATAWRFAGNHFTLGNRDKVA